MTEIDLKKVVSYIHCELNRQNVRAVISDLYPHDTLWRNLLSNVVACGIVTEIQRSPSISRQRYALYVKRLMDEFGVQEAYAHKALQMWIDLYSKLEQDVAAPNVVLENKPVFFPSTKTLQNPVAGKNSDYKLNLLSSGTAEITGFAGKEDIELVVPNIIDGKRIIGIASSAFAELSLVSKIIISEGVQYLGRDAFYKCRNLHEIKLPSTLSQLGSGVFSYTELADIKLPMQVTSLPDGIFRFCGNLKNIIIPGNINHISDYAFFGCEALGRVNIGEGVEYIGKNIFDRCVKLNRIELPNSVKMITGTLKDHFHSKFNPEPEKPANFTIACYKGSYAMTYAKAHGYNIEILDA